VVGLVACVMQTLPLSTRTAPFRATAACLRRGAEPSDSDSEDENEAAGPESSERLVTHNGGCHCGLVTFEVSALPALVVGVRPVRWGCSEKGVHTWVSRSKREALYAGCEAPYGGGRRRPTNV
jgi:hypothetical protein